MRRLATADDNDAEDGSDADDDRLPGELGDCQMRRADAAEIKSLKSQLLPMPAFKKQDRFLLVWV